MDLGKPSDHTNNPLADLFPVNTWAIFGARMMKSWFYYSHLLPLPPPPLLHYYCYSFFLLLLLFYYYFYYYYIIFIIITIITTSNEVKLAISKLNNNKANGEDEIPSEMIKYSEEKLTKEVSRILNLIVENKIQEDSFIGSGILVTVQKQGKPKEQLTSLRPITLLNSIRKILSNITMNRIRNKTEEYIDSHQSGFKNGRSTTDIVWSHKWDIAKALTYRNKEYYIFGINLSQVFDTVDMDVLEKILNKMK